MRSFLVSSLHYNIKGGNFDDVFEVNYTTGDVYLVKSVDYQDRRMVKTCSNVVKKVNVG